MNRRHIDQEPDTIAVVPLYPEYIILGTYSLVTPSGYSLDTTTPSASSSVTATRHGSLQILPFLPPSAPLSPSDSVGRRVRLAREDFNFGIYDIHFHPQHQDLLGVSTSDAEILFFLVCAEIGSTGKVVGFDLREIGKVLIEEPGDADGQRSIVTEFRFLPGDAVARGGAKGFRDRKDVEIQLVATTQFGNTKFLRAIMSAADDNSKQGQEHVQAEIALIAKQSFDLEAWTVLPILIEGQTEGVSNQSVPKELLILSGGDDSQLIISHLIVPSYDTSGASTDDNPCELETRELLSDKRTHEAGVVSLCHLDTFPSALVNSQSLSTHSEHDSVPSTQGHLILTGSYDEHIRLFHLQLPTTTQPRCRLSLLSSFKMPGSVWSIQVLDHYRRTGKADSIDYVLVIAGHTAGAFIARLKGSYAVDGLANDVEQWTWHWTIEKAFTEHDSLVYAVAVRLGKRGTHHQNWNVLSASFYDKRVCNWAWCDEG